MSRREEFYDRLYWLVDRMFMRAEIDAPIDAMEVESAASIARDLVDALRYNDASMVLPPSPALEQWRRRTLEDTTADPLARAAAWELTAIQCEQSGAHDLAEKSRSNAVFAMRSRRAA